MSQLCHHRAAAEYQHYSQVNRYSEQITQVVVQLPRYYANFCGCIQLSMC